jgi:hypothetical protein
VRGRDRELSVKHYEEFKENQIHKKFKQNWIKLVITRSNKYQKITMSLRNERNGYDIRAMWEEYERNMRGMWEQSYGDMRWIWRKYGKIWVKYE